MQNDKRVSKTSALKVIDEKSLEDRMHILFSPHTTQMHFDFFIYKLFSINVIRIEI